VLKGGWFFKNPKENRSFQQISNCLALFWSGKGSGSALAVKLLHQTAPTQATS
jgi:hypothetical protein